MALNPFWKNVWHTTRIVISSVVLVAMTTEIAVAATVWVRTSDWRIIPNSLSSALYLADYDAAYGSSNPGFAVGL